MSLRKAIRQIGDTFDKVETSYYGDLGIVKNNKKLVKVPNRPGFVYVRLRSLRSELIEAQNDKVEEKYGVPVVLKREGNRYSVVRKNWERYQDWDNENPSLPLHAKTHTFDKDGDVVGIDGVFVSGYQFLPYLLCPLPNNSTNAFIYPFADYFNSQWVYYGNTGTFSFIPYKPASGTSLVLVSIDYESGNPYYQATTGTYISPMVTGISQILPYIPTPPTGTIVPVGVVRLTNTTQSIDWRNIYDLRRHFGGASTQNQNIFSGGTGSFGNITFDIEGTLETGTNMSQPYLITDPSSFSKVYLLAENLGVTGTTVVDVLKNVGGNYTSIFTGTPLSLPYNSTGSWTSLSPYLDTFVRGDILRIDVLQKAKEAKNVKIIASSGVGLSYDGLLIRETDGNPSVNAKNLTVPESSLIDRGGGEAELFIIAEKPAIAVTPSGVKTTTSTSYSDVDGANTDVTITKNMVDTDILIDMRLTMYLSGTNTPVTLAVATGGTDYEVTQFFFVQNSVYLPVTGFIRVAGLAAGSHTFRLRWKRPSGTGTPTIDTENRIHLSAEEVR